MQIASKNPFTGKPFTNDPFTGQAPHKRVLQLQKENGFAQDIVKPILAAHPSNPSKRPLENSAENTPPNKK